MPFADKNIFVFTPFPCAKPNRICKNHLYLQNIMNFDVL